MDEHENAYTGLGVYDPRWAFGNIAAPTHHGLDPLAGMDTSLPPSVDGATLGRYALGLGDDALIMSHRLSEWCSEPWRSFAQPRSFATYDWWRCPMATSQMR